LPRSYPVFKFSATLATILLFFTMGLNVLRPQLGAQSAAFGRGGGGGPDITLESAAATEAPAAAAELATEAPAATEPPAEEPSILMAPPSTATAAAEEANSTRIMETAVSKQSDTQADDAAGTGLAQELPQAAAEPAPVNTVSPVWQWLLAGIALISLFIMAIMRQLSASRWRSKT
jgi:hypothetical protein